MRKLLITALVLSSWLLCAAVSIRSVTAVDGSNKSNQVSISLSGPSQYSVQRLSGGNGLRVIIPDVKSVDINPKYRRLSEVIDYITASSDGQNGIITIKTMEDLPFSHSANMEGNRITISISAVHITKYEAGKTPAPSTKTETSPPKEKVVTPKVNQPEKENPSQTKQEVTAPPKSDSIPKVITPPAPKTLETENQPVNPEQPNQLVLILTALVAVIVCFYIYLKYLRPRKEDEAPAPNDGNLEGTTLHFDSDTRNRMVNKLLEQGWTAPEIAREMRLTLKDVERIIKIIKADNDVK